MAAAVAAVVAGVAWAFAGESDAGTDGEATPDPGPDPERKPPLPDVVIAIPAMPPDASPPRAATRVREFDDSAVVHAYARADLSGRDRFPPASESITFIELPYGKRGSFWVEVCLTVEHDTGDAWRWVWGPPRPGNYHPDDRWWQSQAGDRVKRLRLRRRWKGTYTPDGLASLERVASSLPCDGAPWRADWGHFTAPSYGGVEHVFGDLRPDMALTTAGRFLKLTVDAYPLPTRRGTDLSDDKLGAASDAAYELRIEGALVESD